MSDYRDFRKALWQHDNNLTTLGFNLLTYEIGAFSIVVGILLHSWWAIPISLLVAAGLYSAHEIFKWMFIIYFCSLYSAGAWFLSIIIFSLIFPEGITSIILSCLVTPFVFGVSLYFHAMAREFMSDVDIFDDTIRF